MNWLWHDPQEIKQLNIPAEMPVFPLPNALLFPFVQIPLYVFEPRYRQMLEDCLEGSRFMALSLFKPGWEHQQEPIPSHDAVGVGFVRFSQKNEDGTSSMVLAGVARARIEKYIQWEPYRVAAIRLLEDVVRDETRVQQKADRLYGLFLEQLQAKTGPLDQQNMQSLEKLRIPGKFVDIAAFYAEMDLQSKQTLLEEQDLENRLDRLITAYRQIPEG